MKVTLLGITTDVEKQKRQDMLEEVKVFAGAQAGICYMADKYFGSYVTDKAKAFKRFSTVAKTGHHSIADHVQVTLLLEDVPKIVAMFLNNEKYYATSEKSGRYTEMTGSTCIERELYDKWCRKFADIIVKTYKDKIDSRTVDKLAKENARYLLSVFTPTTMSYTTSIRQWNYIMDWLDNFDWNKITNAKFKEDLMSAFSDLRSQLEPFYIEELRDFKGRGFSLINVDKVNQSEADGLGIVDTVYSTKYLSSFAGLAQAQRHRTLNYVIDFSGDAGKVYIPEILECLEEERREWMTDISLVSASFPQGLSFYVLEQGDVEDFVLKCEERLCGRAQLEIVLQTQATLEKLGRALRNTSMKKDLPYTYNVIDKCFTQKGETCTKCMLLKGCKESCVWGAKEALTRKI